MDKAHSQENVGQSSDCSHYRTECVGGWQSATVASQCEECLRDPPERTVLNSGLGSSLSFSTACGFAHLRDFLHEKLVGAEANLCKGPRTKVTKSLDPPLPPVESEWPLVGANLSSLMLLTSCHLILQVLLRLGIWMDCGCLNHFNLPCNLIKFLNIHPSYDIHRCGSSI